MEDQEYLHMFDEEVFHWWYVGMRAITLRLLPPESLAPSPVILDAGCGTGYNIGWLQQRYGADVTGLDFSSHALEFCRRRGARTLIRADIASIPLLNNNYDLVLCCDVLSQLKDATARSSALDEFFRVLKPGGWLLLRVPAYMFLRSGHDDAVMTYHRYGMKELKTIAAAAGFEIVRLTGANTLLFPLAALWRILKKIGFAPGGSDVRPITRGKGGLNLLLASILRFEASVLRRFSFGFGLSIFLLAAKPGQEKNCAA